MATLTVAGSLGAAAFGKSYPPDAYANGPYAGPVPNYDYTGVYAPAPPSYAYIRPSMPGPGYYWVDGYWNFAGRRDNWVAGSWKMRPYAGGYCVAPRYTGGRSFFGFWGGGRPVYRDGYNNGNGDGHGHHGGHS